MPEIKYDEIIKNLSKKIYHPVYLLWGEESYFIDQIALKIENDILSEPEKEFNLNIIYGRDADGKTVKEYASQVPMMPNYQVVIVREAQDVKNFDELKDYIEKPSDSSILVLCYKNKKFDKRKTIYKSISAKGVVFESKKLTEKKVPVWIESHLKTLGYAINNKAVMMLTEFVGKDISKVSNEISKLIISLPKNTTIDENHIEQNIGISKDYNVFELVNALSEKNILKANRIVNYFAANPKENSIFAVLPFLFSFFTKLMIYHETPSNTDSNSLASKLGIAPYRINEFSNAAKKYSYKKLIRIIGYLRDYDLRAKGVNNASTNEGELIKELIYKILH